MEADWDLEHRLINQTTFQDDTTLEQAQHNTDIQGISFFSGNVVRANHKFARVEKYKLNNHQDDGSMKNILVPKQQIRSLRDECLFYQFRHNTRAAACFLTHFQLRHLLTCTSNSDVYFLSSLTSVSHLNTAAYNTKVGTRGIVSRVIDQPQNTANPLIFSSVAAYQQFVIVGGYRGELVVKNVQTQQVIYDDKVTQSDNAITNYIEIFEPKSSSSSASTHSNQLNVLISQNDDKVRLYDMSTNSFSLKKTYDFEYPINHCSLSPNQKMITIAGDEDDILICEFETGKVMTKLKGHLDFSFATAWKPDSDYTVATGSQDATLRIWDLRMVRQDSPTSSVCCIGGIIGPIRSLHYSADGMYLAAAEPADFVRVIDTQNYEREQQIDVFGEIIGVSFSPQDANYLFVGISDRLYASVVEFSRVKFSSVTDDVLL